MNFMRLYILICTLSIFGSAQAKDYLGKVFDHHKDELNESSATEILTKEFLPVESEVPNFGLSEATFWLKAPAQDVFGKGEIDQVLLIEHPTLLYVRIHAVDTAGKVHEIAYSSLETRRNDRLSDNFYSFPMPETEGYETLLIEIRGNNRMQIPIKVYSSLEYQNTASNRTIFYGVFIGIMVVMILYNLFIFFSIRSSLYLWYVVYISFSLLTQVSILGLLQAKVFTGSINALLISLSTMFVGISGSFWAYKFLKVRNNLPAASPFYMGIYVAYFVGGVVLFFNEYASFSIMEVMGGVAALVLLTSAFIIRRTYKPANFFIIAWLMFLLGIVLYVLSGIGWLPYSYITSYTMPIGAALETILLSFALADRINILKKEKEQSQAAMLNELRSNKQIIEKLNQDLERKVDERTMQLKMTNDDLNATLDNLKAAQSQLVNSEKMASLGQLTAGIAHEINNPINFVSSNVAPLRRDIEDILNVLKKYQNSQTMNVEEKKLLQQLEQEIDIEYCIEEINSLIHGIEEGAKRTSTIVQGLKSFSRTDDEGIYSYNVNQGLKSTLAILKSELGSIKLVLDYGNIPKIDCYSGKLNQVFMNLLDNAIHAVKEAHEDLENAEIRVSTEYENEHVSITISDNGVGMKEEVKEEIFLPFFTTKEVGRGTGLGLSISYGIIEKHGGTIEVESTLNKGTTFKVTLPETIKKTTA
jgi:signal transduction histidine kinase